MIFRVSLHEITVLLDDEMVEERPTPEVAADYLHRCATEVLALYDALPAEASADPEG